MGVAVGFSLSCHWWQGLGSWRADRYDAPGLLKVPGRLEFAMCVRPQPFEGAEAAHFPLGPKLPRRHVASEISD